MSRARSSSVTDFSAVQFFGDTARGRLGPRNLWVRLWHAPTVLFRQRPPPPITNDDEKDFLHPSQQQDTPTFFSLYMRLALPVNMLAFGRHTALRTVRLSSSMTCMRMMSAAAPSVKVRRHIVALVVGLFGRRRARFAFAFASFLTNVVL